MSWAAYSPASRVSVAARWRARVAASSASCSRQLFRERGLSSLQPVGHFPYLLADAGPATVLVPGVQLLCGTGKNQGNGQTSR